MFKWLCLTVAVCFLGILLWMVNDVRLQVRESSRLVRKTGETVNEHLPVIVEKTRVTTDLMSEQLPEIVEKTRKSTETLADLADDIRQLKDLAGISSSARDKSLVTFAAGALDAIEASGGIIGLKKTLGGSGLKSELPAQEWASGARKEAVVLTVLAKSKKDLLKRLMENKFGSAWYIQFDGQSPQPLFDWLKANYEPANEL